MLHPDRLSLGGTVRLLPGRSRLGTEAAAAVATSLAALIILGLGWLA